MPIRLLALALPVALMTIGCGGPVVIGFRGNVIAARVPGAACEDVPAAGEPVASAVVRVCRCSLSCVCDAIDAIRSVKADASGRYQVPTIVLEPLVGVDNVFVVVAEAPGFDPVTYSTNYDRPTDAERAERLHATSLNFRMRRRTPAPVGGSPRLDALLASQIATPSCDASWSRWRPTLSKKVATPVPPLAAKDKSTP